MALEAGGSSPLTHPIRESCVEPIHIAPKRRPISDEDPLESTPHVDSAGVYEGLRAEDLGYGNLPPARVAPAAPARREGTAAAAYGVVAALVLVLAGLAVALFW